MKNPIPTSPPDLDKWKTRASRLPALHDLVRRHMDKAVARQVRNYNKNRREGLHQVGDLVRHRNHVLSSAEDRFAAKQAPRFVGPAKVVQVYSPVVYLVEDLDSKRRTKVFVNDSKKYTPLRETQQLQLRILLFQIPEMWFEDIPHLPIGRAAHQGGATPPNRPLGRGVGRKGFLPLRKYLQREPLPRPGPRANSPPSEEGAALRRPRTFGRGRGFLPPAHSPSPSLSSQLPLLSILAPIGSVTNHGTPEFGQGRYFGPAPSTPSPSPSSEAEKIWFVDSPAEWVPSDSPRPAARLQEAEATRSRASVRPAPEAGRTRPGCWNCGEFGHSRTACPQPRHRLCFMCSRQGITIATCPTCHRTWGERRMKELGREPE